jgi:hypothetical protein
MKQTLRGAERDSWLRERMGEFMRGDGTLLVEMMRREEDSGFLLLRRSRPTGSRTPGVPGTEL